MENQRMRIDHSLTVSNNLEAVNLTNTFASISRDSNETEQAQLKNLLRNYNHMTVEKHIRKSRKELKAMDLIDVRNLLPDKRKDTCSILTIPRTEAEIEYLKKNKWYTCLPCFKTGVLQMNTDSYIEYAIQDIQEYEYTVKLWNYTYANIGWEPGVTVTAQYQFPRREVLGDYGNIYCNILDFENYVDYYHILDEQTLHLSKNEQRIWKVYLEELQNMDDAITKQSNNKQHIGYSLAVIFINTIPKISAALEQNKPKLAPGQRTRRKPDVSQKTYETPDTIPKKKVRIIGTGIKVKSEKPPKMPTMETVIRYKTPSWTTRGHMRTYQNGKQVWIKESVHKRHAMQDADPKTTTIKFKKPTNIT